MQIGAKSCLKILASGLNARWEVCVLWYDVVDPIEDRILVCDLEWHPGIVVDHRGYWRIGRVRRRSRSVVVWIAKRRWNGNLSRVYLWRKLKHVGDGDIRCGAGLAQWWSVERAVCGEPWAMNDPVAEFRNGNPLCGIDFEDPSQNHVKFR